MPSSIWGLVSRRTRSAAVAAAAALFVAATGSSARAQEAPKEKPGSAYSFSAGTTVTSHFISYGADVWGGGNELSPLSPRSTAFAYGTLTAKFTDHLSGFVNLWSDLNNNVDSAIGGPIQEIDFNTGLTFSANDFSVSVTHGYWIYADDEEKILDLSVSYADNGKWVSGLSLNPNVIVHWRYDGNNGQDDGLAIVPGVSPTIVLSEKSDYPLTLSFPVSVAFFNDNFQGGDSGLGFVSAGAQVAVPLAFIPPRFGVWTASASVTFYHTPDDTVPNNPRENFFVTAFSLGTSF